jgi:hypothetical protein
VLREREKERDLFGGGEQKLAALVLLASGKERRRRHVEMSIRKKRQVVERGYIQRVVCTID